MIYAEIIFLHISNGTEILFVSILKLIVDTFVSFLKKKKGGRSTYYLPLKREYRCFRFINDNSKKERNESVKVVQ